MKLRFALLTAVLLSLGTGVTSASPITLSKQNPSDAFDGGGRSKVKIYNQYPRNRSTAIAGGFRLNDGVSDFVAWCLDITHSLSLPSKYSITDTPFSNSYGLNAVQRANVENLFETNFSTLDLNDNAQSAGFQLALWEVVYEHSGNFDVLTGSFYSRSVSQVLVFANQFLGNLGGKITQNYDFNYYESLGWQNRRGKTKYSQNLVSVTPVPLPAAGLLLSCGLAGLYFAGRRKKSKASVNSNT